MALFGCLVFVYAFRVGKRKKKKKDHKRWDKIMAKRRRVQINSNWPSELWFQKCMETKGLSERFLFQHIFHQRIFDFWFPDLCVAVEVDGKAFHDREKDIVRDAWYQESFGVRIFRVWAFDESGANEVIDELIKLKTETVPVFKSPKTVMREKKRQRGKVWLFFGQKDGDHTDQKLKTIGINIHSGWNR